MIVIQTKTEKLFFSNLSEIETAITAGKISKQKALSIIRNIKENRKKKQFENEVSQFNIEEALNRGLISPPKALELFREKRAQRELEELDF